MEPKNCPPPKLDFSIHASFGYRILLVSEGEVGSGV